MADVSGGVPADRIVSFGQSVPLFLRNYFQFNGRSSRGAYWWLGLVLLIVNIITTIIDMMLFPGMVAGGNGPISVVIGLGTLIPSIAIGIRRLHDIGRTGWWTLIALTIVGIILLIYWACQPGERKENRFGADAEAGR